MKNYTTILREYNLKATPQRLAIIESVDRFGHINIDNLYEEVKNKFSSISLATIYKNINSMISNMLLLEVKVPNQKSVYEMVKEQHSHLICDSCGAIVDIKINTSNIEESISKDYNFIINKSDVVFSGNCEKCR